MISIIICSINKQKCEETKANLQKTIGFDNEIIVYDNTSDNLSLCEVYNKCARGANGDYLCFVHEDVLINTDNWGVILTQFYESQQNAGVIGFAGGRLVSKMTVGWHGEERRENYIFPDVDESLISVKTNPKNELFSEVILLDGMFLFVSKQNWESNPFDEVTFNKFHYYDMDFTMSQYCAGRINYVCHNIEIVHLSRGSYSKSYFDASVHFRHKFRNKLPAKLADISFLAPQIRLLKDSNLFWNFMLTFGESKRERLKEIRRNTSIIQYIITILAIYSIKLRNKILGKEK